MEKWDEKYNRRIVSNNGLSLQYNSNRRISIVLYIYFLHDKGFALTKNNNITTFTEKYSLVPIDISVIYELKNNNEQILIPYAGFGYSYYNFRRWIQDDEYIRGYMHGYHGKAGIKILLDILEPNSEKIMKSEWEIENTYFVVDVLYSKVNNFGNNPSDLGGVRYTAGIVFEF